MPVFTTKSYEQILTQMIATVVTRSDMSDISDASQFKHALAAAARSDDEQYYQMTQLLDLFSIDKAKNDDLDERAKDIQPSLISRNSGAKSQGYVVISRTGITGTVVIPTGVRIKTTAGITVVTTAASSITAGNTDSALIPAIAEVVGSDGNVIAGTLIKFVSKPVGVDAVTNPSAFASGLNKESDDSFVARLKDFIAALANATVHAHESKVLGAEDSDTGAIILYSKEVEDQINLGNHTLYIDDGTGLAESTEAVSSENVTAGLAGPPADSAVGGEEYLFLDYKPIKDLPSFTLTSDVRGALVRNTDFYINMASGQINFTPALVAAEVITADYTRYTGLIALAQKIVDGDPTDRVNYPGVRAAGTRCTVNVPQVFIQNITATLTILEGYDQPTVRTNVKTTLLNHINTLNISDDVLLSDLISVIKSVDGVYNCFVTLPTADTILLDDQLARTTVSNLTVT